MLYIWTTSMKNWTLRASTPTRASRAMFRVLRRISPPLIGGVANRGGVPPYFEFFCVGGGEFSPLKTFHRRGSFSRKNRSVGGVFFDRGGVPILGISSQKQGFYVEIHLKYLKFSSLAPAALAIFYIYILAGDAPKNKRSWTRAFGAISVFSCKACNFAGVYIVSLPWSHMSSCFKAMTYSKWL